MHKGKARSQSWSDIPFDPPLYHWDLCQSWHLSGIGVEAGLTSLSLNLLSMSWVYLAWLMKVPSLLCLTLKPRKNFNSPIDDILNLEVMKAANSSLKALLGEPNIIPSTYSRHTNNSPLTFLVKRVGSICPTSNPRSCNNSVRWSYHARGACLRP